MVLQVIETAALEDLAQLGTVDPSSSGPLPVCT